MYEARPYSRGPLSAASEAQVALKLYLDDPDQRVRMTRAGGIPATGVGDRTTSLEP